MALFAWPLQFNRIRQQARNHTFGMVHDNATKAHQGWDLEARPHTSCYAVADGKIKTRGYSTSYGNWIELEFEHPTHGKLYAVYCHLSVMFVREGQIVSRGDQIAFTATPAMPRR